MIRSVLAVAAAAALLTACGEKAGEADRTEGPVVSAAESPANMPVDTAPAAGETALTPGANSFTEAQARGAIEGAGYTGVGPLTQNEQGIWQGMATKAGKQATVAVDYKGAVTPM